MVEAEFGTSSAFRGWLMVFGYGFGVRGRKVQSRDCRVRGAGVSQNRDRSRGRKGRFAGNLWQKTEVLKVKLKF